MEGVDGPAQLRFNLTQAPDLRRLATGSSRGASPIVIEKVGGPSIWSSQPPAAQYPASYVERVAPVQRRPQPNRGYSNQGPAWGVASLDDAIRLARYDIENGTVRGDSSSEEEGFDTDEGDLSSGDDWTDGWDKASDVKRSAAPSRASGSPVRLPRPRKYQPSRHHLRDDPMHFKSPLPHQRAPSRSSSNHGVTHLHPSHGPRTRITSHSRPHSYAPSEAMSSVSVSSRHVPLTVKHGRKNQSTKRIVENISKARAEMKQHLIRARLQASAEVDEAEVAAQLSVGGARLRAYYDLRKGLENLLREGSDSKLSKAEVLSKYLSLHRSVLRQLRVGTGLPHEDLTDVINDLATETELVFDRYELATDDLCNLMPVLAGLSHIRENIEMQVAPTTGRPAWNDRFAEDQSEPEAVKRHREKKALRLDGGDRRSAKKAAALQAAIASLAKSRGMQPGFVSEKSSRKKPQSNKVRAHSAPTKRPSRPRPRPRPKARPNSSVILPRPQRRIPPPSRAGKASEPQAQLTPLQRAQQRAAESAGSAQSQSEDEDPRQTPEFARETVASSMRAARHDEKDPQPWENSLGNQPSSHFPPYVPVGTPKQIDQHEGKHDNGSRSHQRQDNSRRSNRSHEAQSSKSTHGDAGPGTDEWIAVEAKKRTAALLNLEKNLRAQRQVGQNIQQQNNAIKGPDDDIYHNAFRSTQAKQMNVQAKHVNHEENDVNTQAKYMNTQAKHMDPQAQYINTQAKYMSPQQRQPATSQLSRSALQPEVFVEPPTQEQILSPRNALHSPRTLDDVNVDALVDAVFGELLLDTVQELDRLEEASAQATMHPKPVPQTTPLRQPDPSRVMEPRVRFVEPGDESAQPTNQHDSKLSNRPKLPDRFVFVAGEHQEGALPPKPVAPQLLFVPEGLTQSIFQHKDRFLQHMNVSSMCDFQAAEPWRISERISENILDGILADISSEILGGCDTVIDGMVASELKE